MHRFLLLSSMVLFVACSSDKLDMTGSYRMTQRHIKSRTADSTSSQQQMKIYTGGYEMHASYRQDTVPAWGVSKVLPDEDGLRESFVYGALGEVELPKPHIYTIKIEKTDEGFRQTIPDMPYRGQMMELTEEYARVDSGIPTPYDGAWELTKAFIVNGADTTHLDIVQYKFYHSGSFIFGHVIRDSLKNSSAGFGYGTFDMPNDSTLTEHVESSSYAGIVGKSFNIKVNLDGKDKLFQIVDELEGAKSVESYTRLRN